ncbi:DNA/RNA nuclease SfsA [Pontibacter sp. JAM-7]|uniref:DNA/RNA nuclease SfsA n=1 Tax=Pontibacter sp. JAM-7 TaxID=3366581 RepID=UPI003AF5915E
MQYPLPLQPGRLIKRYKRFLADIELDNGHEVTVHCPNTGSMRNCAEPGSRVWVWDSGNAKRKYPMTWELVEVEQRHLACINTARANSLVAEAITAGVIPALAGYAKLRREVPDGEQSRIDFLLQDPHKGQIWVEVKNVTLLERDGWGSFPDAVTTRGARHLRALQQRVEEGDRAVLLFCVAHQGIERVRPADQIDPGYGRLLRQVVAAGVEVLAYRARISQQSILLQDPLPVILD